MNWLQILHLASQISAIVSRQGDKVPAGDIGLYLIARSLCEQLERAKPGIAQDAGFEIELGVFSNLPSKGPRWEAIQAEITTELL